MLNFKPNGTNILSFESSESLELSRAHRVVMLMILNKFKMDTI